MRAAASPLRGNSPMRGAHQYSSTSTLLQEISTLRSRLRDLEDDTKSSVIAPSEPGDAGADSMLKKDVARLEEEKAMQEKEFLNQMTSLQVENKKQIDEMKAKLSTAEEKQKSLSQKLDDANKENEKLSNQCQAPTDPESFARKLEDVREMHAKEMEQMKTNLISADKEIGDNRAEIDALQEELFELQSQRHELLDEITSVRMDVSEHQKRTSALTAELQDEKTKTKALERESKEKDSILEKHMHENVKLRKLAEGGKAHEKTMARQLDEISQQSKELARRKDEIAHQNREIAGLQETVTQLKLQYEQDADDTPISLTEKAQLLHDMQEIETRLARFHTKLAEKDSKIDSLTDMLTKERARNKGQSKLLTQSSTSNNKQTYVPPPIRNKRSTEFCEDGSPRTPVAGLVASFERRLVPGPTVSDDDDDDIVENLQREKDLVGTLQEELRSERDKVLELEQQVEKNPDRAELNHLRSESVYQTVLREDLERKLRQDKKEIERLRHVIAADSTRSVFDEEKKDGDEDSVADLRAELAKKEQDVKDLQLQYKSYKSDTEENLGRLRTQVDALQVELEGSLCKIENLEQELELRNEKVQALESLELDHTMSKAREAEILNEQTTERKSFEGKVQELESEKIALENELGEVKEKLKSSQADHADKMQQLEKQTSELRRKLDAETHGQTSRSAIFQNGNTSENEVKRLTAELTATKTSMAEMERSYTDKMIDLEREMALIEAEADQELDAKQQVIQDMTRKLAQKEDAIDRMEEEKGQMRSSVANISTSRKDQLEELQMELLDMTSLSKDQSREILSLKSKIEELDTHKEQCFKKQQRHIADLEDEVEKLYSEGRNKHDKESMGRIKAENLQLREALREMKHERRHLKDRLDGGGEKTASRSSQVLRERNAKLKQEVEKLTRRLKRLEDSITRVAV